MANPKGREPDTLILDRRYNTYLSQGEWRICKRKAIRVDIRGSEMSVYISYPELSTHLFGINMIAEFGARYITEGWDVSTLKGHVLNCIIQIGQQRFNVQSKMVTLGDGYASVEFVNPHPLLRALIREAFKPELMAARLAPFHSFSSLVAGPTHTTIYSDGASNTIELLMKNDQLEAVRGEMELLDIKFSWARNKPVEFVRLSDRRVQGPSQRNRLLSFIRNLPDMNPRVRLAIEQAIRI